jgi:Bacterial PH domain
MSAKEPAAGQQFPGQHEGETVELLFRQHPLVMRKELIIGLLLILVGVLPLDFPQVYGSERLAGFFIKVALGMPILVLAGWFYRWVGWYYTVYIVTNRRILAIRQKGFFDRQVDEWQLEDISNVNYHVGGFQAVLFGFGDITARTYIGDLEMKKIHQPAKVHDELVQAVRRAGGGSTRPPD